MLEIDLAGKVALIMGACKGEVGTIGFGVAEAMARAGADIIINDLPGNPTFDESVRP